MTHSSERFKVIPAVFAILKKDGKILFARRANTGWRDGYYSLPSGHLEGGETIRQALCREVSEEIGLEVTPSDLMLVHVVNRPAEEDRKIERVNFYFNLRRWDGEPVNNEPDKCDDLQWFSPDNLPENTEPGVRDAIGKIENGENYSEFGW